MFIDLSYFEIQQSGIRAKEKEEDDRHDDTLHRSSPNQKKLRELKHPNEGVVGLARCMGCHRSRLCEPQGDIALITAQRDAHRESRKRDKKLFSTSTNGWMSLLLKRLQMILHQSKHGSTSKLL